jgi:hypothetical protein
MRSLPQEATDQKAGCGKSARPVWREGWSSNLHPYPYFIERHDPETFFLFFSGAQAVADNWSPMFHFAPLKNKKKQGV